MTVNADGTAREPVYHPSPKLSAATADIHINGPLQTNLPHTVSATVINSGEEAIYPLVLSTYLADNGILTSMEVNVKTTIYSEVGTATDMLFEGVTFTEAGNYVVEFLICKDFHAAPYKIPLSSYFSIATMPFTVTPATAIHDIEADTPASAVYLDLQGHPLNGKPTRHGLYIQGNKKIFIKKR